MQVECVSIPYRQAQNMVSLLVWDKRWMRFNSLQVGSKQCRRTAERLMELSFNSLQVGSKPSKIFQTTANWILFQFLIGRLKTSFRALRGLILDFCFNSLQVGSKLFTYERAKPLPQAVSIPYRQAQNARKSSLPILTIAGFNSLQVGSKHTRLAWIKSIFTLFQFLIGRLKTS